MSEKIRHKDIQHQRSLDSSCLLSDEKHCYGHFFEHHQNWYYNYLHKKQRNLLITDFF
jgi:hypothetical protein